MLDPRSPILDPRSSILDPRSWFSRMLDPRSPILDPRSSILVFQETPWYKAKPIKQILRQLHLNMKEEAEKLLAKESMVFPCGPCEEKMLWNGKG